MKKALFLIPLALLLSLSLIAIGCPSTPTTTAPTTTAPTTTTPTTTTPTTTEPEVITVTVSDHNPAGAPVEALDYWAAWLNEQSGGRLDVQVTHGGGLLAENEALRGTQTNVADAAYYVVDGRDGFLLSTVLALPFFPWPEQHVEDAYWALLDEFPEMAGEWEDVTLISFIIMPGTHIHTTGTVIETPDDMQGLQIMGAEAVTVATLNALGATAVDFDIMEMTPSLETNLLDGVLNHFPVLTVFGSLEFLPYHTIFGGGINHTPMGIIFNTEFLNGLPSDLRDLIIESGDVWLPKMIELDTANLEAAIAYAEENNHTFTYLTDEEIKVWYDAAKGPIHDAWIDAAESAGLPGQAVYDRALELAETWVVD